MGYFSWAFWMVVIIVGGGSLLVGCMPTEEVKLTDIPTRQYPVENIQLLEKEKKNLFQEGKHLHQELDDIVRQQNEERESLKH